jgi:hypothetical protein
LFQVDRDTGEVFLSRYIEETDPTFQYVKVAVHDNGKERQLETQALLHVRIDIRNATFSRREGPAETERNILIAGIICGATIIISIVIFVVICQVKSSSRHPRRNLKNEWDRRGKGNEYVTSTGGGGQGEGGGGGGGGGGQQRDKLGIQEECGKHTEMEKVVWKVVPNQHQHHNNGPVSGSAIQYKAAPPADPLDGQVVDEEEVDLNDDHVSMGKVVQLPPWSNEKDAMILVGGGRGGAGSMHHARGLSEPAYQQQQFYTFSKVQSITLASLC